MTGSQREPEAGQFNNESLISRSRLMMQKYTGVHDSDSIFLGCCDVDQESSVAIRELRMEGCERNDDGVIQSVILR